MRAYVKNRFNESKLNKKLFDVEISIKDDLPNGFNLINVIKNVENLIPYNCFTNVDSIHVGHFPELVDRSLNAAFANNTIYVTNDQQSESDMVDDIVHELSHAVEEERSSEIYSDGEIEREFLEKRKILYSSLEYDQLEPPEDLLLNPNYDKKVDDYLFIEIGYPNLEAITSDYFLTPYSITSIREYWATGFEFYFYGKYDIVKTLCPKLYKKIEEIV